MNNRAGLISTVIALLALRITAGEAHGALQPLSTSDRSNGAASGNSYMPAYSGDGRFVVFVSHANNLVTNDNLAPYLDVFVRDLVTSNTIMASVNITGTGGGNSDANFPSISSNGQFVAFASMASNLVNNDTNGGSDIFVRDVLAGTTILASVDATGTSSAGILSPWTRHRLSSNPLISADGRRVVFESLATNLTLLTDTNQATDIFARDLQSNITVLVSVNAAGDGAANGSSEFPSMTPDGRLVAFASTSTDLVPGVVNRSGDIYVRDLQSGSTAWVWANTNAASIVLAATGYRCFNPVLSADGRFVVFKATTPSNPGVYLVRHDLQAGLSTVLTVSSSVNSLPQISADGRFVASEASGNIYVWDLVTRSNTLVSVNLSGSGGGNQPSHTPVMSPDGGTIVFLSAATDLANNATNGLSQIFVRDLANATTRLVSGGLDGFAARSDAAVTLPALRADGRQIAFESMAANLAADDLNQANDIFLRDVDAATTQILSQPHPALAASTAVGMSTAWPRSISADGVHLVFSSDDSNLVSDDEDEFPDLFASDLSSGTIRRLNIDKSDILYGNLFGTESAISASGRYLVVGKIFSILFPQNAPIENIIRCDLETGTNVLVKTGNLSAPVISSDGNLIAYHSTNGDYNVYVQDMTSRTNRLVSKSLLADRGGLGYSVNPLFSPDDRWLVFASTAPDLVTNILDGSTLYLFARDLRSETTRLISVGTNGSRPFAYSRGAVFSPDSLHVAFVSTNNSVALYDFSTRQSTLVCDDCDNPSISAGGRLVAYETPASTGSPKNIVVQDLLTGATNLISINRLGTGGGDRSSVSPLLSWDGRFVVFASKASDLTENDTNGVSDIFVRDRVLGTTLLISQNVQGTGSGNGLSSKPLLAADGRTVLFQSFASDLLPGDYNDRRDVFVLRLGGPDSDADGMEDGWEMAFFGTLARNGAGDFDGDGQTDLEEFRAGTDPTDTGSILRVLTLNLLGGGGTRVIWSTTPGKSYQVQFKTNFEDSLWNNLGDPVVANGTTASMVDNSTGAANQRFYRTLLTR